MQVKGIHSFNGGLDYINQYYPQLLQEVLEVIKAIDAESCRLKDPKDAERNRLARIGQDRFYSPPHLNALFDHYLFESGWEQKPLIKTNDKIRNGSRELDFIKDRVGLEIQIGKYAFLTYDIVAKMVIFKNLGLIDCGIEVCPMQAMLPHMSTGIGSYEQVRWDLIARGETESDVPVVLIGFVSDLLAEGDLTDKDINPERDAVPVRYRYDKLSKSTVKKLRETGLDI